MSINLFISLTLTLLSSSAWYHKMILLYMFWWLSTGTVKDKEHIYLSHFVSTLQGGRFLFEKYLHYLLQYIFVAVQGKRAIITIVILPLFYLYYFVLLLCRKTF